MVCGDVCILYRRLFSLVCGDVSFSDDGAGGDVFSSPVFYLPCDGVDSDNVLMCPPFTLLV